jgi:hypothetical protein
MPRIGSRSSGNDTLRPEADVQARLFDVRLAAPNSSIGKYAISDANAAGSVRPDTCELDYIGLLLDGAGDELAMLERANAAVWTY